MVRLVVRKRTKKEIVIVEFVRASNNFQILFTFFQKLVHLKDTGRFCTPPYAVRRSANKIAEVQYVQDCRLSKPGMIR